ncbi:family 78 glycoside hydrolase catalytic domain [Ruficoccus amylovorans]|uniref:alpha-L-rhamnosidase n=1 Tax=Ruficoccus amylovorans TaxID=1804625 RepID=A0A842H8U3_9BACT|nr:family 78 glycoside hydrolase catalytic domain [Ruficoccus amylovorans]MBC2592635.1 family 78 glycoside hydrolase catalytic domain [Ruficoccus amylovorans]
MKACTIDLQCENRTNPLGLDELRPRFSWKMQDAREGACQRAYRIVVGTDADGLLCSRGVVWDSGVVKSADSVLVAYQGEALKPRTRYYWCVCVWDKDAQPVDWSTPAYWETGFLGQSDWPAQWIALPIGKQGGAERPCRYLRKTFILDSKPLSARLYITACGVFEPSLNGQRIGTDWFTPGWTDYSKRIEYLTYDVTAQLQKGSNCLGVILADGWYCGYLGLRHTRNHYGQEPVLLAALIVRTTDGKELTYGSDESWEGGTGGLLSADLYNGEVFDARCDAEGWCAPQPCPLNNLQTVQIPAEDLAAAPALAGKIMPPTRVTEVLSVQSIRPIADGSYIIDFGQNLVGVAKIRLREDNGTRVVLRHGEMLEQDGTLYTENLRSAKCEDVYVCNGHGMETYTPRFTFHGFRYLEIRGLSHPPQADDITALVLHTDMRETGSFHCSNVLVNGLQNAIRWGQRGNFLEIPTDCPQRDERLGWTGDAQIFCRTSTFNYEVSTFFRKWLGDVRDAQYEDGSYPDVAPDLLRVSNAQLQRNATHPHSGNAAWAEVGILCPWTIYERYGDTRILEENYPSMLRWMDYQQGVAPTGICPNTAYGDWLATDAVRPAWGPTPCDLIGTAYYARSARIMAQIAATLGKEADRKHFSKLHAFVRDAFVREYVTEGGRLAGDTQTGYALAIVFELLPPERIEAAARAFEQTLARRNDHLSTGFVGTPVICPALSRIGRDDLAYKLLLNETYPSWLMPIRNGATTMWERWDSWTPQTGFGDINMNSFNHYAYGAIGEWMYAVIGGIDSDPSAPGFRHFFLAPRPGGGITCARAELESPYGKIVSDWELEAGNFIWQVVIPPNSEATLRLPSNQWQTGRLNSHDLSAQRMAEGVRLQAGRYRIELTNPAKLPIARDCVDAL